MNRQKTDHHNVQKELKCLQKRIEQLEQSEKKLKTVEDELKRERDFSTAVLDAMDALVLVLDEQGCVVGFNRGCEKITGYSLGEVLGKSVWDLGLVPKNESPSKKYFTRLFDEDFYHRGESVLYTKAGERRIIQWSSRQLPDDTRGKAYIITTGIDVTGHKGAERRLSRALEQTRKRSTETTELFKSAHVILQSTRLKSVIKKIVGSCKKITGALTGHFILLGENNAHEVVYSDIPGCELMTFFDDFHVLRNFLRSPRTLSKTLFWNEKFSRTGSAAPGGSQKNVSNVLSAPTLIGGNTEGVLLLANKPGRFNQTDARVVSAFGELIAIALRNTRTLESRERSEERFRALAESSPDAIFITDNKKIIFYNKSAADMYGYDRQELLGTSPYVLIPDRYKITNKEGVQKIAKNGSYTMERPMELHNLRKDGTEFPVEYTTSTWKADGRIFLSSIIRDITERKRAEHALRESEEKLSGIINSITDSMVMIDAAFKVRWANEVARNVFGTRIVGESCYNVFCKTTGPCRSCIATRCFKDGKSYDQEKKLVVSDAAQRDFWCTANVAARHDSGAAKIVILVLRDITERNKLIAEAMHARHLASIGELAAGVAHEINNPVNGIINYAQILVNACTGDEQDDGIPKRILREGDRIAAIVKSLLSFARENKTEKKIVDIEEVLFDTLALTEAQLKKDHIHLDVTIADKRLLVFANPQQLQQVFLNIINNARYALNQKYSGSRGKKDFIINAAQAVVKSRSYVRCTFYDNGTGIADNLKDKIINPFFTTKPLGKGTGLGLSISHGIVQDHHGRIDFNSVAGEYTMFTVDVPTQRKAP